MTKYDEELVEKLDIKVLTEEKYDSIMKDRLDFGFDSIYFRYAEVVKELSFLKEREEFKRNRDFDRKRWEDSKLRHFYCTLEQLLHAHEDRNNGRT